MPDRERRSIAEATVGASGNRLIGRLPYGALAQVGRAAERIRPGAFRRAVESGRDIPLLFGHEGALLARTGAGTLAVRDTPEALEFEVAALPDTSAARDLRALIASGDVAGVSLEWLGASDEWSQEGERRTRTVTDVEAIAHLAVLHDPAYESSSAELRGRSAEGEEPMPEIAEPQTPEAETPEAETPEPEPERRQAENPEGLTVEQRGQQAGGEPPIEQRVIEALRSIAPGESRSLTTATASAGPLTPEEQATFMFDRLRAMSIGLASGIRVVPTGNDRVTWPALVSDVDPDWVAELEEVGTGDPGFTELEADPKDLAHLVTEISNRVIETSDPGIVEVLNEHLLRVLALKLDLAIFEGLNTNPKSITGIKYVAGVQSISMGTDGAAIEDYDPIVRAVGKLRSANVPEPFAAAMHPDVATELALLKQEVGSKQQLDPPREMPPVYTSSQLSTTEVQGTSSDARSIYVYSPAALVLVARKQATITLDRSRLFHKRASEMLGELSADLLTPHPQAVCRITGITPPA